MQPGRVNLASEETINSPQQESAKRSRRKYVQDDAVLSLYICSNATVSLTSEMT